MLSSFSVSPALLGGNRSNLLHMQGYHLHLAQWHQARLAVLPRAYFVA
jgi:hypothetical protein